MPPALLATQRAPRVLMVVLQYPPLPGGAENQAHLLTLAVRRRGLDVQVLSGQFAGLPKQSLVDGVAVTRLAYPGRLPLVGRALSTALLLLSAVVWIMRRRKSFDLVHAHIGNPFTAAALLGARVASRPSILKLAASGRWSDLLMMRSGGYGLFGRLLSPVLLTADRFAVLNAESEAELARRVDPRRVQRIPNGLAVDGRRWARDQVADRAARLGAPASGFVFAAGRLDPQKGFDLLIQACAPNGPEIVIAGRGPEDATLRALAARLEGRVRFLGQVDHAAVADWLLAAALVVAPSRAEGMSNLLLEAMALGCPLVASAIPGNVDLIEHGSSGWLVAPEDATGLRQAIDRLLSDGETTAQLGQGAAERVAREFTIDSIAARYANLYADMCEH